MEVKRKYVIFSGPQYVSGGTLALHLLCRLLNEKGQDAKIFLSRTSNGESRLRFILVWLFLTNIYRLKRCFYGICRNCGFIKGGKMFKHYDREPLKCPEKYLPIVSDDTIVVYPEVVRGNPLKAKRVARWFLNKPGFFNGNVRFGDNDLFFAYDARFNDYSLNPECRLLKLTYVDKALCRQENFGRRNGNCYIIRKGKNRKDLPDTFDGPVIDNLQDTETFLIFNRCKYCISYDVMTWYSIMAAICGCISIVMLPVDQDKWMNDYYGRARANTREEIEHAISTLPLLRRHLFSEVPNSNAYAVENFIKVCNDNWTSLSR